MTSPAHFSPAKPPELETSIHDAAPYGHGVFKRLGILIFEATLWTDAAEWSPENIFALSICYHRSFSGHDLAERSLAEMRRIGVQLAPDLRRAYESQLNAVFRTVKRGDVLTGIYTPAQGAAFFHNGAATGTAEDTLSLRFFDIWLSPRTSEPGLRDGLLNLL